MSESSEKVANEALMAMGDEIERLRAERDDWHKVADARSAEINRLMGELAAAKAVIENIVVSEVEPLQALLRELDEYLSPSNFPFAQALRKRIRAELGDEPK